MLPLLLYSTGCARTFNALTNNPDMRKQVNEKGKASCLKASLANQKQPVSPELNARLNTYCDCITDKGLSQFSNAELMEIGLDTQKMQDPRYKNRMLSAARTCNAEVFHR